MLVFDVELFAIQAKPQPPPAPEDVAEPPASAEFTRSGLASRVLLSVIADELSRDRMEAVRKLFAAHAGPCAVTLEITIPGESETVVALPEAGGVETLGQDQKLEQGRVVDRRLQ